MNALRLNDGFDPALFERADRPLLAIERILRRVEADGLIEEARSVSPDETGAPTACCSSSSRHERRRPGRRRIDADHRRHPRRRPRTPHGRRERGLQELHGRPMVAWVAERLAPQVDEQSMPAKSGPPAWLPGGSRPHSGVPVSLPVCMLRCLPLAIPLVADGALRLAFLCHRSGRTPVPSVDRRRYRTGGRSTFGGRRLQIPLPS